MVLLASTPLPAYAHHRPTACLAEAKRLYCCCYEAYVTLFGTYTAVLHRIGGDCGWLKPTPFGAMNEHSSPTLIPYHLSRPASRPACPPLPLSRGRISCRSSCIRLDGLAPLLRPLSCLHL